MKRLMGLLLALCLPLTAIADVPEQVQAPHHLTVDPIVTATGITTMIIDAEVSVPQVEAINTYLVSQARITEETARAACEALGLDASAFQLASEPGYLSDIVNEYGGIQNGDYSLSVSNEIWKGEPSHTQMMIEQLNAPYEYFTGAGAWPEEFLADESMEGCTYTREEAEAIATAFVEQIAPELVLAAKGIVKGGTWVTGRTAAEIDAQAKRNKNRVNPCGYLFMFGHGPVDGIPVPLTNGDAGVADDREYLELHLYEPLPPYDESLCIAITDAGIGGVHYKNPFTVGEVLETDVELLTFSQIIDIAVSILPLKFAITHESVLEQRININRISLDYMRVSRRDDPHHFDLIPVWRFFGNAENQYDGRTSAISDIENYSFLTLDACTGFVIDGGY